MGILRETKTPIDNRTPLTPLQAQTLCQRYADTAHAVEIYCQPSDHRCFSNEAYRKCEIPLKEDLGACDILLGVKEPDIATLLAKKTYLFFSHTTKKQPYNLDLLRAILSYKIRLIDYEHMVNASGERVIAFGRYAGLVGAHNALWAYGVRDSRYHLPRAYALGSLEALKKAYVAYRVPPLRVVLVGKGRVGLGAAELLTWAGFSFMDSQAYVSSSRSGVYTHLNSDDYFRRKDGGAYTSAHFHAHPQAYESFFTPFLSCTDVLIYGPYWHPASPRLFTLQEAKSRAFSLSIVSDITCDIGGAIPFTLRASTIQAPLYYYDIGAEEEVSSSADASGAVVAMMAVDNLPNELAQNASTDFGKLLCENVLGELIGEKEAVLIRNATLTSLDGILMDRYRFLEGWVYG